MMSAARLAGIPISHVASEIAAFPLASEPALRLGVTELSAELSGTTAGLWREAEYQALGSFPAFSVDEVVAIRDKIWFGNQGGRCQPLGAYVRRLAGSFLERRGGRTVPQLPGRIIDGGPAVPGPYTARAGLAWRWITFALPPDLLFAATGDDTLPGSLNVVSPNLDQVLRDYGYAETHLHLGCALDFPLLWVITLCAVTNPVVRERSFQSPGACLAEGRELAPWLVRAALTRSILAAYLATGSSSNNMEQFVRAIVSNSLNKQCGPWAYSLLLLCFSELRRGQLARSGPTFASWQALYGQVAGVTGRKLPTSLENSQRADPIAPFFAPKGPGGPTPEMQFVIAGLARLETGPRDPLFEILFWQLIRIRSLFYRHVVQRPMTPGLQWFIRFYDRMKAASRTMPKELLYESAAMLGGAGKGLRSLEMRTSPDPSHSQLTQELDAIDTAAASFPSSPYGAETGEPARRDAMEYGMVLHFSRDRGGHAFQGIPTARGLWSHADPGTPIGADRKSPFGNPTGYRYAYYYQQKRREALSFAWVLQRYPVSLEILRGVDLCTDELGVPAWVFVPLFHHVRAAGHAASAYLRRKCGRTVPPLRISVHAGEDFVHLLTGLRNVAEVLRYFDLRQGDRLGHGLALGVDPREWARRAGRIPICCEQRLLDLVWEWAWLGTEPAEMPANQRILLEREIARLSEKLFGKTQPPYLLDQLVRKLHDPETLRRVAFPSGPISPKSDLTDLELEVHRYLTDRVIFQRGREIEWLNPRTEGELLAALQSSIRRKLGEFGITIEVNPTSNLLVSDLQDLTDHPLWRLRPPGSEGESPPLSVCVGSDDPLTFGTNLRQEYQSLYDALTLAGLSDEEARRWLNDTRASSLESRFTVPRTRRLALKALRNTDNPVIPLPP
jgi:adenosine deaminase